MRFEVVWRDEVPVLQVIGRLNGINTFTEDDLRAQLEHLRDGGDLQGESLTAQLLHLVARGYDRIVLDLSEIDSGTPEGADELFDTLRFLSFIGVRVHVVGLNDSAWIECSPAALLGPARLREIRDFRTIDGAVEYFLVEDVSVAVQSLPLAA